MAGQIHNKGLGGGWGASYTQPHGDRARSSGLVIPLAAGRWAHVPTLISQGMSRNATRAGVSVEEPLSEPQHRVGENCSGLISNSLADIESSLQRDAEAAYVHPEVGLHGTHQPHGSVRHSGGVPQCPSAGSRLLSLLSTARVPQYSQAALA